MVLINKISEFDSIDSSNNNNTNRTIKITNSQAILAINSKAAFGTVDDDVNKIEWLDETTPIPIDDIIAKRKELEDSAKEQVVIDKNDFTSGQNKLKALGLTDNEIKQLFERHSNSSL